MRQPLELTKTTGKFDVVCRVEGGGVSGQAGAIRHGSPARCWKRTRISAPTSKPPVSSRDPRMKERKKYGLKAARRAPQFSKR